MQQINSIIFNECVYLHDTSFKQLVTYYEWIRKQKCFLLQKQRVARSFLRCWKSAISYFGIITQTEAEFVARGSNLINSDKGRSKAFIPSPEVITNPILSDSIRCYPRATFLKCYLCFGYSSIIINQRSASCLLFLCSSIPFPPEFKKKKGDPKVAL